MRSITMIKRINSTIQDFKYFKETLCEIWCSLNAKEIIEFSKDETIKIMKVIEENIPLEQLQSFWAKKQFPHSSMLDSEKLEYEEKRRKILSKLLC